MAKAKIRGKLKEQKYEEAVVRNISNMNKEKYRGVKIEKAKRMLGVRDSDTSHDEAIEKKILPEKKKKKNDEEEK